MQRTRLLHRAARQRHALAGSSGLGLPLVAVVGYTNAVCADVLFENHPYSMCFNVLQCTISFESYVFLEPTHGQVRIVVRKYQM